MSEAPADLYLGELKARDPWTALLLTMFCPGLGSVYLGQLLSGILVCLLYVVAVGAFIVAWASLKFFPLLPGLVLLVAGSTCTIRLALRSVEQARVAGDYLLRGCNHAIVYALVAAVFYIVPMAGLAQYTAERLWTLVWVETEAMFPTLVRGDLLLVDRTAYRETLPQAGDLVVIRHEGENGPLRLGRVLGLPGDEVAVHDASPIVNGRRLSRSLVAPGGPEADVLFAALDHVTPPADTVTVAEQSLGTYYLTAEQPAEIGMVFEPVVLADEEYYVLHDNRGHYGDSRDFGPVALQQIVGQPLYVAYSRSAADGTRWSRAAKRVQPERAQL